MYASEWKFLAAQRALVGEKRRRFAKQGVAEKDELDEPFDTSEEDEIPEEEEGEGHEADQGEFYQAGQGQAGDEGLEEHDEGEVGQVHPVGGIGDVADAVVLAGAELAEDPEATKDHEPGVESGAQAEDDAWCLGRPLLEEV